VEVAVPALATHPRARLTQAATVFLAAVAVEVLAQRQCRRRLAETAAMATLESTRSYDSARIHHSSNSNGV
jgi:hypothetical protein